MPIPSQTLRPFNQRGIGLCFFVLLFCGVLAPWPALAAQCSAKSPTNCANVDELLESGGEQEVRMFLQQMPGVSPKKLASDDIIRVLVGPPQERVDLPGELSLFSACQIHNCDDKGLLIVRDSGEIIAAGIVHYKKYPEPILTVFMRDANGRSKVEALAKSWAQQQLDSQSAQSGEVKRNIDAVEVRLLKN